MDGASTLHDAVLVLAQAGGGGDSLPMFLLMGATIAIFYFLMWRPQAKQQAEHRALLTTLKKGDEVITTGGIIGKIAAVEEKFVMLELASGKVRLLKGSVQGRLAAQAEAPAAAGATDKKEEK